MDANAAIAMLWSKQASIYLLWRRVLRTWCRQEGVDSRRGQSHEVGRSPCSCLSSVCAFSLPASHALTVPPQHRPPLLSTEELQWKPLMISSPTETFATLPAFPPTCFRHIFQPHSLHNLPSLPNFQLSPATDYSAGSTVAITATSFCTCAPAPYRVIGSLSVYQLSSLPLILQYPPRLARFLFCESTTKCGVLDCLNYPLHSALIKLPTIHPGICGGLPKKHSRHCISSTRARPNMSSMVWSSPRKP